jgi:asparagine synthase (glutamine-hydrolysing)
MCGILAILGNKSSNDFDERREHFLKLSKQIRHRGPDWNGIYLNAKKNVLITHERLSIIGINSGTQPIVSRDNKYVLSVNGEIYNYKSLYSSIVHGKYRPMTNSDCEVIIPVYDDFENQTPKMLDGIFTFILYDNSLDEVLIARDPIGIIPLYYGLTEAGEIMFASEAKCLIKDCEFITTFPPGYYLKLRDLNNFTETDYSVLRSYKVQNNSINTHRVRFEKYYTPVYESLTYDTNTDVDEIVSNLNCLLTRSVEKRLMTDVPYAVLLSGGLDSSLVASITSRISASRGEKLHSFSVGLKGAPDLLAARKVAKFLGTIHHEIIFTVQDGLDCIRDLIWHLETYDTTTIRASTPMYLLSRKIKAYGIKMVLSGEGADEILGGYLYFHNAPSNQQFHEECVDRVQKLHHFDCLRANKSTMAWGVEARVPFLDQEFIEYAISISPELKLKDNIEKWILREAFNDTESPYLPQDILWRQKEQFSDGVGYSWIDGLKNMTEASISDEEFSEFREQMGVKSKEEMYYKKIYNELFPENIGIKRWIPRTDWDGVGYDPSGRAQGVHNNKY